MWEPSDYIPPDLSKFTDEQLKAFTEINKAHCKTNNHILSRTSNTAKFEFKIPKIDASQLKKSEVYPDTRFDQLESPVDDIIKHINKARLVAEHEYIKANMIIIDQDLAETNHLIVPHFDYNGKLTSLSKCGPMIFGLNVEYKKNLTEDLGVNFIITEVPDTDRIKALEKENAELREQLNKIKELLGV